MTQSTTEVVDRIGADQADPGPARISRGHLVAKALKASTRSSPCAAATSTTAAWTRASRWSNVRHEQVAAHAADGYARISGNLGVPW